MFELVELSYARVPDYVAYTERYPELIGPYGDLKDVQRPWALEKLNALLPKGAKVLDLGGSACELASVLSRDFTVDVVDPYDGSGNGPRNPDYYRNRFPSVNIIQGLVTEATPYPGHDVVVSTSVVEHIEAPYHQDTVLGIAGSLKPGGYSVHAIDVSCKGVNGFLESSIDVCQSWIAAHGVKADVRALVDEMLVNIDTYFLPVTMYMRWKKARAYDAYPWRKVGSVQVVCRKI